MISEKFLMGRGRHELSNEEKQVLEDGIESVRQVPGRKQIVRAGDLIETSTLLIEGFVCRYMDDREGQRQLVAVHVPGDFVDLHAFPMKRLDHDIATLGPVKIACFEHRTLQSITERYPHLTQKLWFSTLLDAAMHREWIFRLGRLGAEGRIAHLFCELNARLEMIGMAAEGRYMLPMTQPDLAEATGLTGVHVNRVLRALREKNLLTFKAGEVNIVDPKALAAVAEFEPQYLYGSRGE
ncbi:MULTISPECIES: Crp/Fnr family transcriptional regulator [unclassified Sphingomonas]|uniref:Crp/Fnr family transcriptional regulator n=1 Tax=unclassified Sphingomonas TaxID=196159 RepID=UPI000E71EBE2|nr:MULTISPECIES: Crp/Fnr family transcriptional regulator [unclassified Sphingomonas]RKE53428.1 CRP-like cAMP-binding protein [Sphingomonas sp. PP-CC-1A-547]TCM09923.1 CRP-like cAMP-binding protein [Sphingomonas sp. PP-CC-3G-468]